MPGGQFLRVNEPTLMEKCAEFTAAGLQWVGLSVSSTHDWDQDSSLMWSAAEKWLRANPNHAEILQEVQHGKQNDLRWERDCVGWAVMVGRKP